MRNAAAVCICPAVRPSHLLAHQISIFAPAIRAHRVSWTGAMGSACSRWSRDLPGHSLPEREWPCRTCSAGAPCWSSGQAPSAASRPTSRLGLKLPWCTWEPAPLSLPRTLCLVRLACTGTAGREPAEHCGVDCNALICQICSLPALGTSLIGVAVGEEVGMMAFL